MSLESWKAEFYPTPATEPQTAIEALEHSLRKWRGLTASNLKHHRLRKSVMCLADDWDQLDIDGESCALCQLFNFAHGREGCTSCPITLYRCKDSEEEPLLVEYCYREYRAWTEHKEASADPYPMIKLLEEVLAWYQATSSSGDDLTQADSVESLFPEHLIG